MASLQFAGEGLFFMPEAGLDRFGAKTSVINR